MSYYGRNNYGNNDYGRGNNNGRTSYSPAEKRAYYSGQGYKLGREGKAINFQNEKNRQSFSAGFKSIDPTRYPNAKSRKK